MPNYYFARGTGCEVLWWVCLSVCLSVCPRGYLQKHTRPLPIFLCILPMSVAWFSSGTLTTGRIAYRREGFFPHWQCIYLRNHMRDLYQILVRVAYVRGSILWHVYDRPHRLSPGRGYLPHWKCIIGRERGMGAHSEGKVWYLRLLSSLLLQSLARCSRYCVSRSSGSRLTLNDARRRYFRFRRNWK